MGGETWAGELRRRIDFKETKLRLCTLDADDSCSASFLTDIEVDLAQLLVKQTAAVVGDTQKKLKWADKATGVSSRAT